MQKITILIIEDDAVQIQSYQDKIQQFNKKNIAEITYQVHNNFEDGKNALKSPDFDAAIIDLKLSSSETLEGVELVKTIYNKLRIPIVIYSGSIAQIDDIDETALLKKRIRTTDLNDILFEIVDICKTGITGFLRPQGSLDNNLTKIFWNHLAQDLSIWIEHNNPDTLLRYILSHFQEYLDVTPAGEFEQYHPSEVYIKPPIKTNIHTGDIIDLDQQRYLILTPACDLVFNNKNINGTNVPFRKADKILLAPLNNFDYIKICKNNKGVLDKGKIQEFVKNNNLRYHYLPPCLNDNGYLIDFQDLKSVNIGSNIERVASVSSPFIKDIISRFSNYYSRQGQPTFDQDKIVDELLNKPS